LVTGRRAVADALREKSKRALDSAAALGVTPIPVVHADYPARLSEIVDPPAVLWVSGDASILPRLAVALVGSRAATTAGIANARRLGRDVTDAGLVVVSGLARGVDRAAHEGALDAGGPTVAVLGNGTDISYPRDHREISDRIARSGALVSEFPPGTLPLARHFPLRNRIISGLSAAVVVVEASERSGSLITARLALEQGRDVLAVPGNVASGCYRGCHALIKDGARLVETVDDILEEVAPTTAGTRGGNLSSKPFEDNGLAAVIARGEAVSVDELAQRTGRSGGELMAELGRLEVAGRIVRMAGGLFSRLD
jgi:DNA processing protein